MPEHEPGPEPAAEHGTAEPGTAEPEQGRGAGVLAQVRHALTAPPSRRQLVVAVVLALVGYGVVVQVRSTGVESDYDALRQQDLIDVLDGLAGTSQRAESEISRLTRTRDELQDDNTARSTALEQARDEVDTLNILAGLVPVTGPGIRVTITEETGTVRLGSMLDLVQELRTVNAEAIQINGEVRVVAQTAFEEAEGGLLVGGTLVQAPYTVDVIGEPGVLAGAVEFALGPRSQLEADGASIDVEQLTSLDIEAVADDDQPQYASPDDAQ